MIRRERTSLKGMERLESRTVLAAQLMITEFAANSQAALVDEEGDRSDWIELYNPSDELVSLEGWYLTDDASDLAKWQFPNVSLASHDYLLVYASGKDRTDPTTALHVDFRLSDQGEYLALVQPDGLTVEYEFGPTYPPQLPGATYGSLQLELDEALISFDDANRYSVSDPEIRRSTSRKWTEIEFDDSAWYEGQAAIGFDVNGVIDHQISTDVQTLMFERNASAYVRHSFSIDAGHAWNALRLRLRYDDGYIVFLNGDQVFEKNVPRRRPSNQSTATRGRESDGSPQETETLYLRPSEFELHEGSNVLAVHGLNVDPANPNFLISAELSGILPGAIDVTAQLGFFADPSPGRPNGLVTVAGQLPDATISLPHGFYESTQKVTLSSETDNATLVYTLDGSLPTLGNGTVVTPGQGGQGLASVTLDIESTTILRVAAFRDGWLPSNVQTATYLFPDDVIRQSADGSPPDGWPQQRINGQRFVYGMDPDIVDSEEYGPLMLDALAQIPSVSLVTDRQHLFDPATGLYVNGALSREGNNESLWERTASLELIHPDGSEGFQIDAGVRMRGGFGRSGDNPKHSFRMFFRSRYGEPELDYPLFGVEGAEHFDKIDLRAPSVPSWSFCTQELISYCGEHTILRDVFGRDTQRAMGQPATRSQYYHLYLNGQYWGVYQSQERADGDYAATYFGGSPEDYDVIKVESFPHGTAATNGDLDAWRALWDAAVAGFDDDANYERVQGRNPDGNRNPEYPVLLDTDNLIDYMISIFYNGDLDAPISKWGDNIITNNWFGIRNRNADEGFKFFVHDGEWALHDVDENRLGPWPAGKSFKQSNPQWIHQQLMANADYRIRFADRAYLHLSDGGALSAERALSRLNARAAEFDLAIIAESARWGDTGRKKPYTKDDWLAAIDRIREEYIPQRRENLIEQFRNATLDTANTILAPLYSDVAPPDISHPGGVVQMGTQVTLNAAEPIYFTQDGSDPRLQREQIAWESLVQADSGVRYFVPTDASLEGKWQQLEFDDSTWTAGANGIGFGSRYDELVSSHVEDVLRLENSSLYARFTFDVVQPMDWDRLSLHIAFDDGFVAYLNGVEVSQQNLKGKAIHWDSRAASRLSNTMFNVDVTDYQSRLNSGRNVLAIQALNLQANDRDLLLLPELQIGSVTDLGVDPSASLYSAPIVIDHNQVVRARTYRNGDWSPIVEAVFETGTVPLRIDELMFHPPDPSAEEATLGFRDDDDFEYIEFINTSDTRTLDLTGFQIQGGVEFTFPTVLLPPGQRTVVVRRVDAFTHRYGEGPRIAGEYRRPDGSNRLSNGGESLQVYDSLGLLVQEFQYRDDWQESTDGEGHSLQVVDVRATDLDVWSSPIGWRSSLFEHGSPGTPDQLAGDANTDGEVTFEDFLRLAANFGHSNAIWEEGDFNGDGSVLFDDFLILSSNFGSNWVANSLKSRSPLPEIKPVVAAKRSCCSLS